jgi:hypothetical protein
MWEHTPPGGKHAREQSSKAELSGPKEPVPGSMSKSWGACAYFGDVNLSYRAEYVPGSNRLVV